MIDAGMSARAHRNQRRRQVGSHAIGQRLHRGRRSPDVDVGPPPGVKRGRKKPRPWRWSRWRWLQEHVDRPHLLALQLDAGGIPMPASSTSTAPSSPRTSTQEVARQPARGVRPGRREASRAAPELHLHDATFTAPPPRIGEHPVTVLVPAEQRVGGDLDLAVRAAIEGGHEQRLVRWSHWRNAGRSGMSGLAQRLGKLQGSLASSRVPNFVGGHLSHRREAAPEHRLRRLVAEDDDAIRVEQRSIGVERLAEVPPAKGSTASSWSRPPGSQESRRGYSASPIRRRDPAWHLPTLDRRPRHRRTHVAKSTTHRRSAGDVNAAVGQQHGHEGPRRGRWPAICRRPPIQPRRT